MHSNSQTKHLWQEVRYDRPTYQRRDPNGEFTSKKFLLQGKNRCQLANQVEEWQDNG